MCLHGEYQAATKLLLVLALHLSVQYEE